MIKQNIIFQIEIYDSKELGDLSTLEGIRNGRINFLGTQFTKQIKQIQEIYNKALNETKESFVKCGAAPLL